ncbi:hypothetical protein [Rufibacter roseus]|uniref:STAS/SEC14 domain-containing protein n=1 Tax=Rufibacter roseus TaxID=1567108 RepID=A0ABW2DKF4_9BACT|nr:hypothetical protein [Rufibacter roseus]
MQLEATNSFGRTFYKVEYNQNLDIIDTLWYGYASQMDLKKACDIGLEILEKSNCLYKLNDNTTFTGPWADAVAWLEKDWLPRAMQAGLKFLAHVAHRNSFGEEAGEVMKVSKIGQELQVGIFTSRTEALSWLEACQKKNNVVK